MTGPELRRASAMVLILATSAAALGGCGKRDTPEAAAEQRSGGPRRGGGPGGRGGPGGGMRIAPVEVAPVEQGSIARSVTVSGTVEPIRTIAVNSQLSGALRAVYVQEGDAVRQGTVMARLDDSELRAQLAAAEAAFQVAQAAYERAQQLRDRQVITAPEYERDRSAFAAARAQRDQLRTRMAYAVVRAPTSGIVTEKRVETGDVVAPQSRLFTIADVSTLVVRVGVSELDVVKLNVGDTASVALDAFPERTFRGRIRRIFPSADPATRLVPVEVALQGQDARVVRPGYLARATFALGARHDVLLVPASALVGAGGSESVFLVEDGKAVRRNVTTGVTSKGSVEIVSGLRLGEQVVTAGSNLLRDGMEVRVVNSAESAGSVAADSPGVRAAGDRPRAQRRTRTGGGSGAR